MTVIATHTFPGPELGRLPDLEVASAPLRELIPSPRTDVLALAVLFERVDGELLDRLPGLRVVANYGVGYDNVDVTACAARGVPVTNTPGVVDEATADLALAMILAGRRRLLAADRLVREGAWQAPGDLILSDDVHGAAIGLVGCGRIGQAVARRAKGFGMRCLYHQRNRLDGALERELGLERVGLDELLGESEVVSLHCPLTPDTEGLIGARELSLMRDGAILVNTARGRIVDQSALVAELVAGRLAAGLDVFADEPRVPEELLGLSNVILSPHLGTATNGTRAAMTGLVVENILAALEDRPLISPVAA